jgi:DNA replication protein DnaC
MALASYTKQYWLKKTSNIPSRFWGYDYAKVGQEMPPAVGVWLDEVSEGKIIKGEGDFNTTGKGLLFEGNPGIGKTTNAVLAAMEVLNLLPEEDEPAQKLLHLSPTQYGLKARPVYYLTFLEYLDQRKQSFRSEESRDKEQKLRGLSGLADPDFDAFNVRLLVLDDVGKETGSAFDIAEFHSIIRVRYDKALPTIVTTNVKPENWGSSYGAATASFAQEAFYRVPLASKDHRGA